MTALPNLKNLEGQPGFRWLNKTEVQRHGDSVALMRIGACSASLRELIDDGRSIFDGPHLIDLCKALGQLIDSDRSLDEHIADLEHEQQWPTREDARAYFADLNAKSDREG